MTRARSWLPDPTRRHELRFWDGDVWTTDVSDGGVVTFDPLEVPVTPPPPDPTEPSGEAWATPAHTGRPAAGEAGVGAGVGPVPSPPGPAPSDPLARFPASSSDPTTVFGSPAPPERPWDAGDRGEEEPADRPRRSPWGLLVGIVLIAAVVVAGYAVIRAGKSGGDDRASSGSSVAGRSTTSGSGGGTTSGSGDGGGTGGDSGTGASTGLNDLMIAAVAQGIVEGSEGAINEDQAVCMGRALIDEVGIDRLEEVTDATSDQPGTNPLDLLTDEERTAAMTRMRACVDQATLDSLTPDETTG